MLSCGVIASCYLGALQMIATMTDNGVCDTQETQTRPEGRLIPQEESI
jgi:hypothetical protein